MKKLRKFLLPVFLFSVLPLPTLAQIKYTHEFTGPLHEELNMKEYAPDPEAEAVVIREMGDYYFVVMDTPTGYYFQLNMVVTSKIKILKQAGLEYADIEIPYYYDKSGNSEQVEIQGVTYNSDNGMITRTLLDQKNVFTENAGSNMRVMKAAMPDVRVGSVIETRYIIKTTQFFSMRPWRFQKKIPVIYSLLQYRATPFYEYEFILKGSDEFDESSSEIGSVEHSFSRYKYKDKIYKFGKKNLPAFRDEEFLHNTDDHMTNLYFQLSAYYNGRTGVNTEIASTWPKLCAELRKDGNFGKYLTAAEKSAKKIVEQLDLDGKDVQEKMRIVTDHVKSMYSWNGQHRLFSSSKLPDFLKEKRGSSADLNLFLVGVLKAAGLESYPVVLSTRSHGRIYWDYPFLEFFDYVIAVVEDGDEKHYADATNTMGKFDEVSYRCANVDGLIIKDKTEEWTAITQRDLAGEKYHVSISLEPDAGVVNFEMTATYSGSKATSRRKDYNGNQSDLEKPFRSLPGVEVGKVSATNYTSLNDPFVVTATYKLNGGELSPDKIMLNPLLHIAPSENPFKQSARQHPIDLVYSTVAEYAVEVKIPEGYEVEYMGNAEERWIRGGGYLYACNLVGDKIITTAVFRLANFFEAEDYPQLKALYGDMIDKFSDAVIIRRTEGGQ